MNRLGPVVRWHDGGCLLVSGTTWLTIAFGDRTLLRLRGRDELATLADGLTAAFRTFGEKAPYCSVGIDATHGRYSLEQSRYMISIFCSGHRCSLGCNTAADLHAWLMMAVAPAEHCDWLSLRWDGGKTCELFIRRPNGGLDRARVSTGQAAALRDLLLQAAAVPATVGMAWPDPLVFGARRLAIEPTCASRMNLNYSLVRLKKRRINLPRPALIQGALEIDRALAPPGAPLPIAG